MMKEINVMQMIAAIVTVLWFVSFLGCNVVSKTSAHKGEQIRQLQKEAIDRGHAKYNSDREFEWKEK